MSQITSASEQLISTIRRTVADYKAGLARIEREFSDACSRIEQSISRLHGDAAKHGKSAVETQKQEQFLRRQATDTESQISKIEERIAKAKQGISAVDSNIHALSREKSGLEQQIENRWLIVKIYYFFAEAEDQAKRHCQSLQSQLDSAASRRSALEQTKQEFERERRDGESRKANLEQSLKEIHRKLAVIERAKGWTEDQSRRLTEEKKRANDNRHKRIANWQTSFAEQWKRTAMQVERESSSLRRHQPAFVDLCVDSPLATEMPRELFLGSQKVVFEGFSCLVPHSIPFPVINALVLPEENASQLRLAHHLLLRLLSAIPPGHLELTLIDPLKLGQSVGSFLSLLKVKHLVPQQRVLTRSDEIEAELNKLTAEVEDLIQRRFTEKDSSWSAFNANHADNPLPFRVLLLFDIPEQLSDKSLWFLERLCENGPRCGVLPILAIDGSRIEDRRFERIRSSLSANAFRLDSLLQNTNLEGEGLTFTYEPEKWPELDALERCVSAIAERCAAAKSFGKSMPDLWTDFSKGATTIGGFDIPIGWRPDGDVVSLRLGATDSEHHALLAGKTGSGKSNLLHVIIHSLSERYSPTEADLYLLDYKESTEFTIYANPPLPHASLVATESDPEYGVTVLRHLADEIERRARIFKDEGVRDFAAYRTGKRERLPRILLVIDEFQVLFSESRHVGESSEQLLTQLLKQGRSFGIHILLATQTLKNMNALSIGAIVSQLGCRIALACGQEDSALILGGGNWEAAELRSPPEGIINNANGAKSGNIRFLIPLAEDNFCHEHIAQMSQRATKRDLKEKTRIFDGAKLPHHPELDQYHSVCGAGGVLLLGESLTFKADPLTVPLATRNAFNILFSGYNDLMHDGLLVGILKSLVANTLFDEIIYYNARGIPLSKSVTDASDELGSRFKAFHVIEALPLQNILDSIGIHRTALIVDGLDSERALHPAPGFKVSKPGDPPSPADSLKQIADEGPRKGTFVFALIENWRRCAGPCKDLLNLFELRIAFCMNEDDAGALVSGGIGKFKGVDKPNRAVFVNRMTHEIEWFRPYTARQGGDL